MFHRMSILLLIASCTFARYATADDQGVKVVQITVRPGVEPVPALRYRLMPDPSEMTPGNAAPLYLSGLLIMPHLTDEQVQQLDTYDAISPGQLPRAEAVQFVAMFQPTIDQLEIAARRERCDWDTPVREKSFMALLPHLGPMRTMGRVLALRAKVQIADGKFDDAARTLATGFAMARHVSANGVLIEALVSASIARTLTGAISSWDSAPNSPGLYWPIAELPRPFVDARAALQRENLILHVAMPALRQARDRSITADQWAAITQTLAGMPLGEDRTRLAQMLDVARLLPKAKAYLVEQGMPKAQVDAMPAGQAIAIFDVDEYERWNQETQKWFALPFWQAKEGLKRASEELSQSSAMKTNPLMLVVPAVSRAYASCAGVDRDIAMAMTIESIRIHLAANNGQLPQSLDELTEEPAPIDPTTGKTFIYTRGDGGFTLESPPTDGRPGSALKYEVTIAK